MLKFNEVQDILKTASEAGFIVVGGQAINGWSEKFQTPNTNPWETLQPFTSSDVDVCGYATMLRNFITKAEENYEVEVELPNTPEEEKVNLAVIMLKNSKGEEFGINCISSVIGVSIEELRKSAQEHDGILIMHPLLCVEAKTHNLLKLDQADRQDEKHLRLSIANLNKYVAEVNPEQREVIAARMLDFSKSGAGFYLLKDYNIDLLDCLPLDKFPKERQEAIIVEKEALQQVVIQEIRSEEWLRQLNPNPFKKSKVKGYLSKYSNLPSTIQEIASPDM